MALEPLDGRVTSHVFDKLALPFALEAAIRLGAVMFLTTVVNGFRSHFWLLSSAAFGETAVSQRV